jgi:hypothetical protein
MSGQRQRGPIDFSSLKKVLPPTGPAIGEAVAPNPAPIAATPETAPPHPFVPSEPMAVSSTAAVQQSILPPEPIRSSLVARPGKTQPLTRPSTFRLAIELQDALKQVAGYNQLPMTDIVAESIWLHLQCFAWPPGSEQLRDKLRTMF